MKNDLLNALLHIHLNGPKLFTKECDDFIADSIKEWISCKPGGRKKLPKVKQAKCASGAASDQPAVITVEVETQTDPVVAACLPDYSCAVEKSLGLDHEEELEEECSDYSDSDSDTESDTDWDAYFQE